MLDTESARFCSVAESEVQFPGFKSNRVAALLNRRYVHLFCYFSSNFLMDIIEIAFLETEIFRFVYSSLYFQRPFYCFGHTKASSVTCA